MVNYQPENGATYREGKESEEWEEVSWSLISQYKHAQFPKLLVTWSNKFPGLLKSSLKSISWYVQIMSWHISIPPETFSKLCNIWNLVAARDTQLMLQTIIHFERNLKYSDFPFGCYLTMLD